MSLQSRILSWILIGAVFVAGALAVRHFWPHVKTNTETVVLTDSAQVHVQSVRIDSLAGVIEGMKLEKKGFSRTRRNSSARLPSTGR
jgi:hypothetical protein